MIYQNIGCSVPEVPVIEYEDIVKNVSNVNYIKDWNDNLCNHDIETFSFPDIFIYNLKHQISELNTYTKIAINRILDTITVDGQKKDVITIHKYVARTDDDIIHGCNACCFLDTRICGCFRCFWRDRNIYYTKMSDDIRTENTRKYRKISNQ